MALPHPHGSNPGEIGHNADIDVGDISGSTGGKFVGFGEFGTSAAANRPHWALSENIDYTYQILGSAKAVPAADAFVSAGQFNYQMQGSVFVGDATYPGVPGVSEPEGMRLLFSVLDEDYKELTDVNGNEVRVARVRDSADVTDIYQGGFATNPTVTFKTIDPNTGGDVDNPYTIPAAQSVRLMHGEESSLENLPTDAFIRFKVNAGAEVPAGVVLQDGTRPMVANFDMNGNSIFDIANLLGEAGNPMILRSYDNLTIQGDNTMTFKDGWLSSPIQLSQSGEPVLASSQYNSLVGSINNIYNVVSGQLVSKRFIDRGGDVTFTNGGQQIHYPTLNFIQKGEVRTIAAGTLVISNQDKDAVVVITETGVLTDKGANAVIETDLPVVSFYFDSGTPEFTRVVDIRQPMNIRMERMAITVGDEPGCDFTDLKDAIECANEYHRLVDNDRRTEIVIMGEAAMSEAVEVSAPIWVHGLSRGIASVRLAATAVETDEIFNYTGNHAIAASVIFEEFAFYYDRATAPAAGATLFKNMPSGSKFNRIQVKEGSGSQKTGTFQEVDFDATNFTAGDYRLDIDDCDVEAAGTTSRFVLLKGNATGRRIQVYVDGSVLKGGTGLLDITAVTGTGNTAKLDAQFTACTSMDCGAQPVFDLQVASATAFADTECRVVVDGCMITDCGSYILRVEQCSRVWFKHTVVEGNTRGITLDNDAVLYVESCNLHFPTINNLFINDGSCRLYFIRTEVQQGGSSADAFSLYSGAVRIQECNFYGGGNMLNLVKAYDDVADVTIENCYADNFTDYVMDNNTKNMNRTTITGNSFVNFGRGIHIHGDQIVIAGNSMDTVTKDALYCQPTRAGATVTGNIFDNCGLNTTAGGGKCIHLTNQDGGSTHGAASTFMGNIIKECGGGSASTGTSHIVYVAAKWLVQGNTVTNPRGSNTTGRGDNLYCFSVATNNGASIIGNYCHILHAGYTCTGTLSLYYFASNVDNCTCMGNICDFRDNTGSAPRPSKFNGIEVHPDVRYSIFAFNSLLPMGIGDSVGGYDCDFIWANGVDRCIWIGNLGRNSSIEISCSSATGQRSFATGNMVWESMAMDDNNCHSSGNYSQPD